MPKKLKIFFKAFLFGGLVYASFMAGYDYFDDMVFNLQKFLMHFGFFGVFMGLMMVYYSNQAERKKKIEEAEQ